MKPTGKLLLILFLISWSALAVVTFVNQSSNYLFKSYFDSDYFQISRDEFIDQLGNYVLAPFDAEKAKEELSVTQEEIEKYRNYYGTLAEQIENIQSQYSDQISQAEESDDTTLKEVLVTERDAKIADIKKNFESDEYVEEKILKIKKGAIDEYASEQKRLRQEFLNSIRQDYLYYYNYHFVNVDTGETFESDSQQNINVYKENFSKQSSLLTVNTPVYIDSYENVYIIDGFQIDGVDAQFEGSLSIPQSKLKNDSEYQAFKIAQIIFYIVWITGILAIIALFTIAKPSRALFSGQFETLRAFYLRIPIDIQILLIIVAAVVSFFAMETLGYSIRSFIYYQDILPNLAEPLIFFSVLIVSLSAVIMGAIWTWNSIKPEGALKNRVKQALLYRIADGIQDLFLNRSVGIQVVGVLAIAFFTGVGFIGAFTVGNLFVPMFILLFFVGIPMCFVFLRHMGYLNRIMKQTEDMAEGRLTTEMKVKGKTIFAKHASNLNALREGVRNSMSQQAKSERLKTELITNVSHDLRTPLTSIITYTDLLKNPNLTEEERNQYIDVLDKKSARLKTLIEDLFEVSKMASGNIEITKQRLDLTQLMKQAIGEHEEEFAKSNFELRVSMPEQPLFAYVDGQKIWRVIDNLIVNALKYSLVGTRIYVTLKQTGSLAEFTVKNISKYELNENVEELTERFKRADASRHTDGSGLGLAIAQSIVDLHNGRLAIDVDGDLFKVTVSVPAE